MSIKIIHRSKWHINGRGDVYGCSIKDNPELSYEKITKLLEEKTPVLIDDNFYTITGIESSVLPTGNLQTSQNFGLIVKKYKQQTENESNTHTNRHAI